MQNTDENVILNDESNIETSTSASNSEVKLSDEDKLGSNSEDRQSAKVYKIIRTIGISKEKIEEKIVGYLVDYIIDIVEIGYNCDIVIKLGKSKAKKYSKDVVNLVITDIESQLDSFVYGHSQDNIVDVVVGLLKAKGSKISIAESFTGGSIASTLIAVEGASAFIEEALVTYSNNSKMIRLNVPEKTIKKFGAVSDQVVYEMAANLMITTTADYVIATTGNAGPTSEKKNEVGLCYIAIGNSKGIHIYSYKFNGNRNEVIKQGVDNALLLLYRKIKDNK